MELTAEETVTKLLSSNEILRVKKDENYILNPMYDLGEFLQKIKEEQLRYGSKYMFIKY